nr:probable thimet oligopeptidase isoform X1 [Ipomoea batatas]
MKLLATVGYGARFLQLTYSPRSFGMIFLTNNQACNSGTRYWLPEEVVIPFNCCQIFLGENRQYKRF